MVKPNESRAIPMDLASPMQRGWLLTNRRGNPGKSIVPFRPPPQLEAIENPNPNFSPQKKVMIAENEAPKHDRMKGKIVVVVEGEEKKQYICSNCKKEFDSHFALGGHRAYHVREERKWWSYSQDWAASWYSEKPPPPPPRQEVDHDQQQQKCECQWCKRTFHNRFSLAAHTRFCYEKKQLMLAANQKPEVLRNFDLNQLPPEEIV